MAAKPAILTPTLEEYVKPLPKIKSVHPFGSKILVEILRADEIMGTKLHIGDNAVADGAPQAYIVETGPTLPADCGIKKGQRIYWTGKGTQVEDPSATNKRVRAMLEISNVLGIIEENA